MIQYFQHCKDHAIPQQRKRLLYPEWEAFHIDVEDRVRELLGYLVEGGILRNTGIREHNIGNEQVIWEQVSQVVFVIFLCSPVRLDSRGRARRESLRQAAEHA